ncbi:hypothetical protein DAERI_120036 [Deinococcus aerius]|uniref:Uncharacterized protein n=1 Tax=Deinococcus aerius TaxID=200253 RepID=A0A2I9CY40_9DEIO|nr:hypothetical protein DAERI_120036 [Deinococcus aerius]
MGLTALNLGWGTFVPARSSPETVAERAEAGAALVVTETGSAVLDLFFAPGPVPGGVGWGSERAGSGSGTWTRIRLGMGPFLHARLTRTRAADAGRFDLVGLPVTP